MLAGNRISGGLTLTTISSMLPLFPDKGAEIHGCVVDGKSYQQGKASIEPTVSGVRIITPTSCACNLTIIACMW